MVYRMLRPTLGRRFRTKPALRTVNHCLTPSILTGAGTEVQTIMFTAVNDPANRGTNIKTGATITALDVWLWASDATPVAGYHRCLMYFQPGATTYSTPIASWLDTTDGLTEEAIQMRQNVMGRFMQQVVVTGAVYPLMWHCRWKGRKVLREADDIVVALQDQAATNWIGYCEARYYD